MKLTYGVDHTDVLEGYTRSNYIGNLDNRKSTSGYIFMHIGTMISWRSKLQDCITFPTTKLEYITTFETTKEVIWLQ